jgi:cytochrome c peroxidase
MRLKRWFVTAVLAALVGAGSALSRETQPWAWALPAGVAQPDVPSDNPMTAAKVALGHRLFHDADLSINGTLSCATCHEQRRSFSDGVAAHPGAHGEPGLRNVPSLLNVAWMTPLTWANPRLTTLEVQATVPITGEDPVEMGMKGHEAEIARRLTANGCYRKLFRKAFPEEDGRIDLGTVTRALAAYQRTITSYDTAWDRARAGGAPLPEEARRGEALFNGSGGCAACHAGINLTDARLHPFATSSRDAGAMRATGRREDSGVFRTPSLRNVALTAPYLHDGSAPTIGDAIARHGIALSQAERTALLAFLDQLTDRAVTADPRFALPPRRCSATF